MKYNIVITGESLIEQIKYMEERTEIQINVAGRLMSISRYYNGFTLWWGGNYGIDCTNAEDVKEKIDMLTSFVIEGEMNKNECYLTKEAEKFMKESSRC